MQNQVYFLNQNLALLLIIAASLLFAVIGILYSRKHQGLSNYLTAGRNVGTTSLTTSLVASALGAWILFGPASAATWGGIGSGIYNTIPVFVGATVGTLVLIGVYFGLNKITKIIPVGMFFRASSILLFALAIYFAYEGIHEPHKGFEELASITPNILIS